MFYEFYTLVLIPQFVSGMLRKYCSGQRNNKLPHNLQKVSKNMSMGSQPQLSNWEPGLDASVAESHRHGHSS